MGAIGGVDVVPGTMIDVDVTVGMAGSWELVGMTTTEVVVITEDMGTSMSKVELISLVTLTPVDVAVGCTSASVTVPTD